MGLVWVTMVTAFPSVLMGFDWYKQGISFDQVVTCTIVSCLLLLAYAVPSSQIGAVSGLGYCGLSRLVFGRWGTAFIAVNILWLFIAWYGVFSVLMAEAVRDILHVHFSVFWMSIIFAFLMAFNNFFAFTGVANFARFVAAPALIGCIGYTFMKALSSPSVSPLVHYPHVPMSQALTVISALVIGYAVWGNEADYWRFSKPGVARAAIPMTIALLIGQVIFCTTGWLVAHATDITDPQAATNLMNSYAFGGSAVIAIIVLAANYFAVNDSNLFGLATAFESIWKLEHKYTVAIFAFLGAITAALLSGLGGLHATESVAALNCVFMPVPTVIMLVEWYLSKHLFKTPFDFANVPELSELPRLRWSATIALFAGFAVGVATSGVIPVLEILHVGICPVQAWLTSAFVYAALRLREYRIESANRLGLEKLTAEVSNQIEALAAKD
jgi:purine-cytosine permease-like protein